MTGNEMFDYKQEQKINNIIEQNPDKPYLIGYRYFINNNSNTTIYNYIRHVISFMNFCNKNAEDLVLDDYTSYLFSIKATTASNQIVVYTALKKFSSYLSASKRNFTNPMQHVARPKYKESQETKEKRNIGYLDKKEIKKYIDTVNKGIGSNKAINRQKGWKERDLAIILIFLNTGIRCSALCSLDVDSIDLEKKQMIATDKGDKVQEYELSDEIIGYINSWLIKRNKILRGLDEKALFISNRKTRLNNISVYNIVNKYAANIKNKHITPHKLRATYGTQLYEATRDLFLVQECMGHNSPKTTELYIRGQKEENKKKASLIMSNLTVE